MMPTMIESLVLGLLSMAWFAFYQQANRLPVGVSYHLAADRRDRRKARFYFMSVWVGLVTAFLSSRCLTSLSGVVFDTVVMRAWVLGVLRGLEFWGLLIIGAVWSQVGLRVSQPNSDGQSLLPVPDEKKNKN